MAYIQRHIAKTDRVVLSLLFMALVIFLTMPANARVVENVDIKETAENMEIRINFAFPLQYIGHVPGSSGDNLRIQFKLNSQSALDGQDLRTLSNRSNLTWDHSKAFALQEMFWDGGDASSPLLTLLFNRHVGFEVEASSDLRSVVIRVNYAAVMSGQEATDSEQYSGLLREAMSAFRGNDYETAIRLLTKIEASTTGDIHKQALEYLGLTRQRNNQLAHAKSQYEKFLVIYPDGPDALRVQQRLSALTTADQPAQPSLRQATTATQEGEKNGTLRFTAVCHSFIFMMKAVQAAVKKG